MQSPALDIRILTMSDLVPAPYNPRRPLTPADAAYKKLAASLRAFGLVEPLVWNERSGNVVGGHLRLAILKDLGVCEVPVSVVRLSPEQERALNVVLNNHEAQGRFDPARLADVLGELADLPELAMTGFDAADLADLQFEPVAALDGEPASGRVEVTITTDAETFEQLAPGLDALVAQFDLACRVKRS